MKKKIENRLLRFIILTALFFLGLNSLLHAQTTDSRFFQRLAWRGGENALRFEVVVEEEEEEGEYRGRLREFTSAFFIEVSLSVGKYRFRVIPHDYRDQPGEGTEWMNFEVRALYRPEFDDTLPVFVYAEKDAAYELNLSGRNLAPDTDIFLLTNNDTTVVPIEIQIQDSGHVRLLFNDSQLTPGEYEAIVRNLNGVEGNKEGIIFPEQGSSIASAGQGGGSAAASGQGGSNASTAGQSGGSSSGQGSGSTASSGQVEPIDVFLSAAWMPIIQINGNRKQNPSPAGAAVRLGVTAPKSTFFSAGLELAVSLLAFEAEPYKAALQAGIVNVNLLAQAWFPDRAKAFTLRVGGGLALLQDRPGTYLNLGASFLWLFQEHLYVEIGLDNAYLITNNTLPYIRPWIGMGWKL